MNALNVEDMVSNGLKENVIAMVKKKIVSEFVEVMDVKTNVVFADMKMTLIKVLDGI